VESALFVCMLCMRKCVYVCMHMHAWAAIVFLFDSIKYIKIVLDEMKVTHQKQWAVHQTLDVSNPDDHFLDFALQVIPMDEEMKGGVKKYLKEAYPTGTMVLVNDVLFANNGEQ